jgi:hypothetical protein
VDARSALGIEPAACLDLAHDPLAPSLAGEHPAEDRVVRHAPGDERGEEHSARDASITKFFWVERSKKERCAGLAAAAGHVVFGSVGEIGRPRVRCLVLGSRLPPAGRTHVSSPAPRSSTSCSTISPQVTSPASSARARSCPTRWSRGSPQRTTSTASSQYSSTTPSHFASCRPRPASSSPVHPPSSSSIGTYMHHVRFHLHFLNLIHPSIFYPDSDLDLYVSSEHVPQVVLFLCAQDYEFILKGYGGVSRTLESVLTVLEQEKKQEKAQPHDQPHNHDDDRLLGGFPRWDLDPPYSESCIHAILSFRHTQYPTRVIQIIAVFNRLPPISSIMWFHSSTHFYDFYDHYYYLLSYWIRSGGHELHQMGQSRLALPVPDVRTAPLARLQLQRGLLRCPGKVHRARLRISALAHSRGGPAARPVPGRPALRRRQQVLGPCARDRLTLPLRPRPRLFCPHVRPPTPR